MVDRVGDRDPAVGQHGEPLRLGEPGLVGPAVGEAPLARTDVAAHRLAVGSEFDQAVAGGVGDEETAVGQEQRLAGEAQMGGDRLGRDIGAVAAAQRALRRVLGLQLLDQLLDGVRMALAGVLGDDIALGVDDDERGPGPYGVLLPGRQFRIVEDRVVDLVPLDGVDDGLVLGLVDELRRVHPDDHQGVAVLLLQLAQLIEDMQTVHTAKGPEIQNHNASSQVGEGVLLVACVEPAALADQFGSPDARTCCHVNSQHHRGVHTFRRDLGEPVSHEIPGA